MILNKILALDYYSDDYEELAQSAIADLPLEDIEKLQAEITQTEAYCGNLVVEDHDCEQIANWAQDAFIGFFK